MKFTFKLVPTCSQAMRDGRKVQHRLPSLSIEAQDIGVGDLLNFVELAPHGQTLAIAAKRVTSLRIQRMDTISDDEVEAEGFPNWSVMAYEWNSTFRAKQDRWDANPEVLVICFGDCV